ncbi:hypothetical protein K432DRAFT_104796, partial [Lepidopterella palustris CBS 459.81]
FSVITVLAFFVRNFFVLFLEVFFLVFGLSCGDPIQVHRISSIIVFLRIGFAIPLLYERGWSTFLFRLLIKVSIICSNHKFDHTV